MTDIIELVCASGKGPDYRFSEIFFYATYYSLNLNINVPIFIENKIKFSSLIFLLLYFSANAHNQIACDFSIAVEFLIYKTKFYSTKINSLQLLTKNWLQKIASHTNPVSHM